MGRRHFKPEQIIHMLREAEIQFIGGSCPGNDYLRAHAPGQLDLSLLQKRLNDLDTGIRISIE